MSRSQADLMCAFTLVHINSGCCKNFTCWRLFYWAEWRQTNKITENIWFTSEDTVALGPMEGEASKMFMYASFF